MKTVKSLYILPKLNDTTIKKLLAHGVWVFNPNTLIGAEWYRDLMKDYDIVIIK